MLTTIFTLTTVIVSILAFNKPEYIYKLMFSPYKVAIKKEWYRFFTFQFVHGDYMHLFFNIFVLWGFGKHLEFNLNNTSIIAPSTAFLIIYLGGHIAGVLPQYLKYRNDPAHTSIGASAGVSAILFACILFDPLMTLNIYFIFPIPAFLFGILYLGYSYYMKNRGMDNINHEAHIYGALFGMITSCIFCFPYFREKLTFLLN